MSENYAYSNFIAGKSQIDTMDGFDATYLPDCLFDFQKWLVEWAVKQGRGAIFADCGLGKTLMQLCWAENVVRKTNKRVLVLTPLAVAPQTVREADTFDIEATHSERGELSSNIVVANYERLQYFDAKDFGGVVCDESSILKNFDGKRKAEITAFMRKTKYRLLCTATAAPNDYTELGTSSEALGWLGHIDMLGKFFVNDTGTISNKGVRYSYTDIFAANKWRFKGHSEQGFWRWVNTWSRMIRKPSDLGFSDGEFDLTKLTTQEHVIDARTVQPGLLFDVPAIGLREQQEEQKRTVVERCEKVASLVAHDDFAIVWCHRNAEGDLLEKLIPGAVQVSGSDSDKAKEEKLLAFADGKIQTLVTKPKIGAWGLNLQHCNRIAYFPSHSFEQYYQAIRRCWRFGQKRDVTVDIVTTEGGRGIMQNLQAKAESADKMFAQLVDKSNSALGVSAGPEYTMKTELPTWL